MNGANKDFLSERDFRELERLLTNGRVAPRLRSKVRRLIGDYVMLRRYAAIGEKAKPATAAVVTAARALRLAIEGLGEVGARDLASSLDAVGAELHLASGRLCPQEDSTGHASLLANLAACCATLERGAAFRLRGRRSGAPLEEAYNEAYRLLINELCILYRQCTGELPKVSEDPAGDGSAEARAAYVGSFFEIAVIVDRAAKIAAGEEPRDKRRLGRWLKRWTAARQGSGHGSAFDELLSAFDEVLGVASDDTRARRGRGTHRATRAKKAQRGAGAR